MICAGITFNGTDTITVQYNAGDGTKGASFNDPYLLEDVYDTAIDGEWGVIDYDSDTNSYTMRAGIVITGAATYFAVHKQYTVQAELPKKLSVTWVAAYTKPVFDIKNDAKFLCGQTHSVFRFPIFLTGMNGNNVLYARKVNARFFDTTFSGIRPRVSGKNAEDKVIFDRCNFFYSAAFNLENQYIEISNIMLGGFNTQIQSIAQQIDKFENISIYGGNNITYTNNTPNSSVFKNVKYYEDGGYTWQINQDRDGDIVTFIDSNISADRISFRRNSTNGANGTVAVNLKNSLKIDIKDAVNGRVIIKDKNENIIEDEIIEGLYETEILYTKVEGIADWEETTITRNELDYQPFSVVISKEGMQDLKYENIYAGDGQVIHLRGEMVEQPKPVIVHQQINGTIKDIKIKGVIKATKIKGVIR